VVSATGGNIALAASSRSAHQQGNREGHVPSEEAGSYYGGKFIETPNLKSQSPHRNTPPTLTCQRSCTMGRGRGVTRVEETKISTIEPNYSKQFLTFYYNRVTLFYFASF